MEDLNEKLRRIYDRIFKQSISARKEDYEVKSMMGPFLALFEAARCVNMSSQQLILNYNTVWRDDIMNAVLDFNCFQKAVVDENATDEEACAAVEKNCMNYLAIVYAKLQKILPKYINPAKKYIDWQNVPDLIDDLYNLNRTICRAGAPCWMHPLIGYDSNYDSEDQWYEKAFSCEYTYFKRKNCGLDCGMESIVDANLYDFYLSLKELIAYTANVKGGFIKQRQEAQQPISKSNADNLIFGEEDFSKMEQQIIRVILQEKISVIAEVRGIG